MGAFKSEAILYRHGGVRVAVSESHDDVFAKNCTAIRVEERLALAVYTPGAFGLVTAVTPPALLSGAWHERQGQEVTGHVCAA